VIFDAIEVQDMPVLMGVLSLVGVFTLLAHIVLDIVHVYLDPRLRVIGKV
jgi:ABC-type dipeptide/oligopeptide/nickel transport system permease component